MANGLKTVVLLGAMSALLLVFGEVLGGAQGLMVGFIFAALMNLGSYWFSDRIVLSMYGAKQAGRMFAGTDCSLCTNPNWVTRAKGLEQ